MNELVDELRRTLVTVRRIPDANNAALMAIALAQRAIDALAATRPDLTKLIADTNKILGEIFEIRDTMEGPINWADLSCREAAAGVMEDGKPFLAVWIEEASPDNYDFQNEIMMKLSKLGYENVQVTTEW
jgi:hypothetical protein